MRPALLFLACLVLSPLLTADESARRFLHKPDSWFASTEAKQVAAMNPPTRAHLQQLAVDQASVLAAEVAHVNLRTPAVDTRVFAGNRSVIDDPFTCRITTDKI